MAAAAVVASSAGDGFVVAVLLGVAAGPWAGLGAGLAVAASVARWGTADLGALAGDQDVLGPAVAVGPVPAAASSAVAAVALLLVSRDRPAAVAAGLAAAAVACGPAPTSAADAGLRAIGAAVAVGGGWAASRLAVPVWAPTAVGVVAVALAVVA